MVNFFFLDYDPKKCAEYYCDKHILKIPIEIAQMLCNVHHELSDKIPPYQKCKAVVSGLKPYEWIKKSINNYIYAVNLGLALMNEYKYRYNRNEHKTEPVLMWLKTNIPKLPKIKQTPFILTHKYEMFQYIDKDPVICSRFLYVELKCSNDKWTKRSKPQWFIEIDKFTNKEKKKLINKINKLVRDTLPKIASKNGYKVYRHHSFLRVIYDNLLGGKWDIVAKKMAYFDDKKSFINQLTYPQLYFSYEIGKTLKIKKNMERLNVLSLKYRKKLNFPDTRVDYRKSPYYYIYKHNEVGVLMVEPYKNEILPYWKFQTKEKAIKSSNKIYNLFLEYIFNKDYIGADMARKYLQMGMTRSKRYYHWKSGKKYKDDKSLHEKYTGKKYMLEISEIFKKKWVLSKNNENYQKWIHNMKNPNIYVPDKLIFDKK